jgi:two-component system, LytTR family, response regulator
MKVLVVDDEPLALRHMSAILSSADARVEVVGACTDPQTALEVARIKSPHLVFMDIEMPVMNGLEAAEKLLQIDPNIRVVFVTAYSHYALEAFDLNALDYLLKPVKTERVRWALQRVQESAAYLGSDDAQAPAVQRRGTDADQLLRILGEIELEHDGQAPQKIAWRTQKSQELFTFLLQQDGQLSRKDMIIDMLWPSLVTEKAYANLYTTTYQMRKTLKQYEIDFRVISADDGYWLEKGKLRIDAQEWEAGVRRLTEVDAGTLNEHRHLMSLNRGSYLQGIQSQWAEDKRNQLDALWIHHIAKVVRYLIEVKAYPEANAWCRELRRRHPYESQSYELLMHVYAATGDKVSAEQQYKLLCEMLSQQFGVAPDPLVAQWYHEHIIDS